MTPLTPRSMTSIAGILIALVVIVVACVVAAHRDIKRARRTDQPARSLTELQKRRGMR